MFSALLTIGLLAAQSPTQLTLEVTPSTDAVYSDAVLANITLSAGATGIADRRVDFYLLNTQQGISCTPGSLLATGADGSAGPLRIRLVDGSYGVDNFVAADPDGEPYQLEAHFAGDGDYSPSQASVTLLLHRETVTVRLLPEHSADIGETVEFVATLVDQNGDVEESGSGTTGRIEKPIADATLHFYVDLNDDGDFADPDEALGSATTGNNGVATLDFDTTPIAGLPRAGLHQEAVRAEFSGDNRYKRGSGLGDLRLFPVAVDATRTIITATPKTAPADGYAKIALEATLLDTSGNTFGPDDDKHDVVYKVSGGELQKKETEFDPATGHYLQELQAPRTAGEVTVTVYVDAAKGSSLKIDFTPTGCGCHSTALTPPLTAGTAGVALFFWGFRRRNREE